jgi:hypothetical protein
MASTISDNLDAMWAAIIGLTTESPASSFEAYADFFEPDAVVYFMGVDAPPSVGREETISKIKELLTFWALLERKVVTSAVDEKQRTVAVSMSNKLRIAGKVLEDFKECEIVSFSEKGLIQKYELYADPTPIKDLLPTGP